MLAIGCETFRIISPLDDSRFVAGRSAGNVLRVAVAIEDRWARVPAHPVPAQIGIRIESTGGFIDWDYFEDGTAYGVFKYVRHGCWERQFPSELVAVQSNETTNDLLPLSLNVRQSLSSRGPVSPFSADEYAAMAALIDPSEAVSFIDIVLDASAQKGWLASAPKGKYLYTISVAPLTAVANPQRELRSSVRIIVDQHSHTADAIFAAHLGHDASMAVVLETGAVEAVLELERLFGVRHHSWPASLRCCQRPLAMANSDGAGQLSWWCGLQAYVGADSHGSNRSVVRDGHGLHRVPLRCAGRCDAACAEWR